MEAERQKHIEQLLERFFDGQTSNAEEQELYSFFNSPAVPEALKPYQPVFGYFETGIKEELNEKDTNGKHFLRKLSLKKWLWIGACAAASILFFLVYSYHTDRPDTFNPYEGSYIVRNGIRITDMEQIMPELESTVRETERSQRRAQQISFRLNRKEKLLREWEMNATNPYKKILKDNPNVHFRQEVKQILSNE